MKQIKLFQSLRHLNVQIAVYFATASLLLIGVLGGVLYFSLSSIILKNELDTTITSVQRSGDYIEVYVEKLKALSKIIASSPDTRDYLATRSPGSRDRVMALINTTLGTDPFLASVILVSKDGNILSNERELDMTVSGNMMGEPWYVAAVNSNSMPALTALRQQAFSMDRNTWVISVSQEITADDGSNMGVLLLDIRYQVLEDYLSDLMLGEKGYAFILDTEDNVVYHRDPASFQDPLKRQELLAISRMDDGYDGSRGILTHHYPIPDTNWTLVGLSSLDGLGQMRRQLLETFVMAGIVLFGIVLGGGVMMASRITNPISELEHAMQNLEQGLRRVPVDAQGCYEAESLARHYNQMLEQIESLMASIAEKERSQRIYEIKTLQSQINPHFLYNTLDTIVWMAEFNDSQKVIAITKSLAQFFRISLSQGAELIPLGAEIDHVAQYLFIQKQRYGDKLSYEFKTDTGLYDVPVPKIILQPLVENAVYHGIREQEGAGHILITAESREHTLILTVADNGVGFDVTAPKKDSVKLGSVGFENVNQRIRLYYGEPYGVTVASEPGVGTTVTVTLPLARE